MIDHARDVDVARLRKELEHVTAHRDQWFQGTWLHRTACGTVACLAGSTVLSAGYRPVYATGTAVTTSLVVDEDGDQWQVPDLAALLLGLDVTQAANLFAASNTLVDLWEIAEDVTDGELTAPPGLLDELRAEARGDVTSTPPTGADVLRLYHQRNTYGDRWAYRRYVATSSPS